MNKRILSFLVVLTMVLSLSSFSVFAAPVTNGEKTVVDDNAGAIIQVEELANDIVTVTATLKGTVNLSAFTYAVSYDATKVVPYNKTADTTLGSVKLASEEEVTPYIEKIDTTRLTGYSMGPYVIDNSAEVKYFSVGFSKVSGEEVTVASGVTAPIFKVYFKKLSGATIDESTFNYANIVDVVPQVSKLVYNDTNVYQAGETGVRAEAFTKTLTLLQDQTAPTGLVGTAPTADASSDGKITGTTTAMEYKLSTAAEYTAVTGTEITGLAAGTYNVRLAAKTGYKASPATDVIVPAYTPELTGISIVAVPEKKVYKVGETLDLSGIVVLGTYGNNTAEYVKVSISDVTGFKSDSPANNQKLTITIDGKTAVFTVNIVNDDQSAPTGLTGTAPTADASSDGKITGTTAAMEYKLSTATVYTAATDTETTGLAAGTYNVRFKAKAGFNASPVIDVVVPAFGAPTLSSIAVTAQPTKTEYKAGESLDITGLEVTGTYSDNSPKVETVTSANITGFDSSKAVQEQLLTVTVNGQTATFTVKIVNNNQTAPIWLFSKAATTADNIDGVITGTTVAMEYKLSTAEEYTAANKLETGNLAAGTYKVRFAARDGYNASPDYEVVVPAYDAVKLSSIAVTTQPTKKIYNLGDAFDATGMVVTGTYSDNSKKSETLNKYSFVGFNSSAEAESQTVTVIVNGKTTSLNIKIIDPDKKYTATIKAATGGVIMKGTSGEYKAGDIITIKASAVSLYSFSAWTSNNGGKFANATSSSTTFTMPASDVTITANFKRSYSSGLGGGNSSHYGGTVGGGTASNTFTDLSGFDWAADSINNLVASGVIKGTSDTTYSPRSNITRADFSIILVRAFNLQSDSTANFSDVKSSDYFVNEIAIAKANGILTGTGNNLCNPRTQISRQDMMLIVVRTLEKAGYTLQTGSAEDLTAFSDSGSISGYAKIAVATLVKSGYITGSNNKINPNGKATRAEVAVLIDRILNAVA